MSEIALALVEFADAFGRLIAEIPATSPLAFAIAAFVGVVIGFSPSSLPLVPVIVGYVAGHRDDIEEPAGRAGGLTLSVAFVLGTAAVAATIGGLFGLFGIYVVEAISGYLGLANLLIAVLLAFIGLALLRKVRKPFQTAQPAFCRTSSPVGAFLLGIPFGFSVCPACSPLVLPILGAAVASGEPWVAAALLFVFGLARGGAVILAGSVAGAFLSLERSARWVPMIERTVGVLLLIAAVFFLYRSVLFVWYVPTPVLPS